MLKCHTSSFIIKKNKKKKGKKLFMKGKDNFNARESW